MCKLSGLCSWGMMLVVWGMTLGAEALAQGASSRAILPFQGAVAVKPGQEALDGSPYGAKFVIYDQAQNGTVLFEDIQSVTIQNGAFAVELGGGATALDPALPRDHADLWLEVAIDLDRSGTYDADEVMAPRIHLGASLIALYSEHAATADTATQAQSAATATSAQTLTLPATLSDGGQDRLTFRTDGGIVAHKDFGDNDPERGSLYRDNAPVAWAYVASSGEVISSFGIRSVSYDGDDKQYRVRLWNNVNEVSYDGANEPEYAAVATSLDFLQRQELAVCEPIDDEYIGVTIFGLDVATVRGDGYLNIPKVTSSFCILVFGRPN